MDGGEPRPGSNNDLEMNVIQDNKDREDANKMQATRTPSTPSLASIRTEDSDKSGGYASYALQQLLAKPTSASFTEEQKEAYVGVWRILLDGESCDSRKLDLFISEKRHLFEDDSWLDAVHDEFPGKRTLLEEAMSICSLEYVQVLLMYGASPFEAKIPLMLKHPEVVDIIVDKALEWARKREGAYVGKFITFFYSLCKAFTRDLIDGDWNAGKTQACSLIMDVMFRRENRDLLPREQRIIPGVGDRDFLFHFALTCQEKAVLFLRLLELTETYNPYRSSANYLLWGVYPLELAELKQQQPLSAARPHYPLKVTLEPA